MFGFVALNLIITSFISMDYISIVVMDRLARAFCAIGPAGFSATCVIDQTTNLNHCVADVAFDFVTIVFQSIV